MEEMSNEGGRQEREKETVKKREEDKDEVRVGNKPIHLNSFNVTKSCFCL